jgi:glycosidase
MVVRAVVVVLAVVAACAPPGAGGDADAGPGEADAAPQPDAAPPAQCERTFTLPGYDTAATVWLSGDWLGWPGDPSAGAIELARAGGGWSVDLVLDPGRYVYKFVVDGTTWVHDAQNPLTEDDGFGGVNSVFLCEGDPTAACGDLDAFDWRDAVMYFVMTDRFFDSDGQSTPVPGASDGDARFGPSGQYEGGDLAGVEAKLPYLADLGVTAIWLSAPFENRDTAGAAIDPAADAHMYSGYHGYWPSPANVSYADPASPSPRPEVESRIGSDADLHGVVDGAHAAGIKVLFDYVMKHVDDGSGLYAAHADWFAYAGPGGGFRLCGPENLWDDPYWGTRCAFTNYLPPFDLYSDAPRIWSVDDAVWWASEYGLDGYRLDAIKHVPLAWLTELRSRMHVAAPDPAGGRFYMVGETFDYYDRDKLKSFVDSETMLDGQFDFPFKRVLCESVFDPGGGLDDIAGFLAGNDTFYDRPQNPSLMTTWIGNHDIPRAIHFASWQMGNCTEGSHAGNGWNPGAFQQPGNPEPYERLGLAFAVMMTNPGIPLIYYGDEIGLAGGGDPDNRRMMPWDDGALNAHQKALRAKVRALARLRGAYKNLGRGYRQTLQADQDVWVYRMTGCGEDAPDVVVALNRADADRGAAVPAGAYTDLVTGADVDVAGELSLAARSFAVLSPR